MPSSLPVNLNFDEEKREHKPYVKPPVSDTPIIWPVPKKEKPVKIKKIKEPKPVVIDLFSGLE